MRVKIPIFIDRPLMKIEEDDVLRVWDEKLQRWMPPERMKFYDLELETDGTYIRIVNA